LRQPRPNGFQTSSSLKLQPLTSHTCKLSDAQAASLEKHLRENDYKFREVPYARFAAEKEKTNVVFYESGKLVVQGKGTQDFVEFVLEPQILQEVKLGYETVLNPELLAPRIGVDESGKGDFFGPLCIAAVYLNETMIPAWKNAGIRDSKNIGSDRRIAELAQLIRDTPGCVFIASCRSATRPTTGFTLKMKSVNTLLAWGHARAIENMMGVKYRMDPPPVRAISDQFAHDKGVIAKALMSLGRSIELVQRHKAEEDLAVAAASILARNEFVTRLRDLGRKYDMEFPKGGGPNVDAAAKEFVAKHGAAALA
jgi:ribonuclease HIII